MITRNTFVWILGTCLLLFGCEKPFDPAVEEISELVVISNFTNTDTMRIAVGEVLSSLDGGQFSYVPDAVVRLFEGDVLIEEMKYVPEPGLNTPPYYQSNHIPVPGVIYSIAVITQEYPGVRATNYIPDSVLILPNPVYSSSTEPAGSFAQKANFDITFSFEDQPNLTNYYHINFYRELFNYKTDPDGNDTTFVKVPVFPLPVVSENGAVEMVPYIDNRGFLLTDESFASNNVATLRFSGELEFGIDQIPGDFIIEVRAVTEAYYRYHVTLARQHKASEDELADPVILYTNIIKGQGIFAGFNSSFFLIPDSN